MPKNAVERLQKIEKDIKTVISIYDIYDYNGKPETAEKPTQFDGRNTPECSKGGFFVGALLEMPRHSQTTLYESFKKSDAFPARPPQTNHSQESLVTLLLKKPTSAVSSKSMITMRESDYMREKTACDLTEKDGIIKAKTFYNMKGFNLCEPTNNVIMTPSKTLQTASAILKKSDFPQSEETKTPFSKSILLPKTNARENEKNFEKEIAKFHRSADRTEQTTGYGILKSKLQKDSQNKIPSIGRSRKETPTKMTKDRDVLPGSATGTVLIDRSPMFYNAPKKNKALHRMSNESKTTADKNSESTLEENSINDVSGERKRQNFQDKKVLFSRTIADGGANEKMTKNKENEEIELWTTELCKKVEKNNEKLEKMKIFKELALEIAKHIKNKYDEIQTSKEELLKKLQTLEKDNERLNIEVKEANETRKKLQQKIAGLMESTTRVSNGKTKKFADEISYLQSKIFESQKQFNEEISEKQKIIEKIQKERLSESRNELKTREILTDELQRLTGEKSELFSRFNQTRNFLRDRDSQIEELNDQIQELKEEVQTQTQNLKTKTDALKKTTNELETLQKNYDEVEEEVNNFKNKIDEMEKIQKNMIQQASEYEQIIKSNQEQINQLRDENQELKHQLESEKDAMRIKIKIIDDQQETIKQMKEKAEETKNILKQNESLERVLNMEREEKLELQDAVERLKRRKEELKKKVKDLENGLLLAPQEVLEDLQKTQFALQELENQVQVKQKRWAMELQLLLQAKEQACNVAEYATKKLIETTNKLQKQTQAYKSLEQMFEKDLAIKEHKWM